MSVLSPMDPPASPVDRVFAQGVYHIVWSAYTNTTQKSDSKKMGGKPPGVWEKTCHSSGTRWLQLEPEKMQPAVPEISTCPNCGSVLEKTPSGELGCMSCLLR